MIVSGTGHRPDKLVSQRSLAYSNEVRTRLKELAMAALEKMPVESVVSGMALGWDTGLALAAIELRIPLIAAVPFKGQESRWRDTDIFMYTFILGAAERVEIVCPGSYSAAKMQIRNQWMVDNSDMVLALWDGSEGGTGNCIKYAESRIAIKNVWDSWVKYSGFFNQVKIAL